MVTFLGCRNLIFDKEQIDRRYSLIALPCGVGAY